MGDYVLVVDDDAEMLEALRDLLEAEGFRTRGARDGADALRHVERGGAPAAVLCDANMPVMGGVELIRRLRKSPRTAAVPVALVSGESSRPAIPTDVVWLAKPIDSGRLVDFVRRSTIDQTRREVRVVAVSLRSALGRLPPESAEAFALLSRAVHLLDELADGHRLSPDQLTAINDELTAAYREIARLRRQRRGRRALRAEEAIDDAGELSDAEGLAEDGDVLPTLKRGLALAERLDRG